MEIFRKPSFADSTGDAIPFYHDGIYHIFFVDAAYRNDGISGTAADNVEPHGFKGLDSLGGIGNGFVSGRGNGPGRGWSLDGFRYLWRRKVS